MMGVQMAEPFTLAALGGAALTQGISFLYNQTAELLKRRRERRDAVAKGATAPPLLVDLAPSVDASVLQGALRRTPIDEAEVAKREDELIRLSERLGSYVSGVRVVDPSDMDLLVQVEALRGLLELAFSQRITFQGEKREATGSSVDTRVLADRVDGQLTVARVRAVTSGGHVRSEGKFGTVGESAHVVMFEGDVVEG
jgi:hypothetical protein